MACVRVGLTLWWSSTSSFQVRKARAARMRSHVSIAVRKRKASGRRFLACTCRQSASGGEAPFRDAVVAYLSDELLQVPPIPPGLR